jgi:two-component system, cell cycle response regulator DivK
MATILIVEDEVELRTIHSTYLSHCGHEVVTAGDVSAGLEAARNHRPDLIVLDHSLPGRSGVDFATELRSDPELGDVPILMVSAHAFGEIGARARAAGCDAFLSKPCQPSRLLQEINRLAGTTHS